MIKTFELEQEKEINEFLEKTKGKIVCYTPKVVISYDLEGMVDLNQFRYAYTNPSGISIETESDDIVAQDIYIGRNRLIAISATERIIDVRFKKDGVYLYDVATDTYTLQNEFYFNIYSKNEECIVDFADIDLLEDDPSMRKSLEDLRALCSKEQLTNMIKVINCSWSKGLKSIRNELYPPKEEELYLAGILKYVYQAREAIKKEYDYWRRDENYNENNDRFSSLAMAMPSELTDFIRYYTDDWDDHSSMEKEWDKYDFSNYEKLFAKIGEIPYKARCCEHYSINSLINKVLSSCKNDTDLTPLSEFSQYLKDYELRLISQEIAKDKNEAIRENGRCVRSGLMSLSRATEDGAKNIAESTEKGLCEVAGSISNQTLEISKGYDRSINHDNIL